MKNIKRISALFLSFLMAITVFAGTASAADPDIKDTVKITGELSNDKRMLDLNIEFKAPAGITDVHGVQFVTELPEGFTIVGIFSAIKNSASSGGYVVKGEPAYRVVFEGGEAGKSFEEQLTAKNGVYTLGSLTIAYDAKLAPKNYEAKVTVEEIAYGKYDKNAENYGLKTLTGNTASTSTFSIACPHKNTTVVNKKDSTCSVKGYTGDTKCLDCNKIIAKGKEIALKAHSLNTVVTKATLTKDGGIAKVCKNCKKTVSKTTIAKVSNIKVNTASYVYNGKAKTPAVTVKDSKGKTLRKNTDYTVTYAKGRKNVGKYKVTVTLKGNYSGTKTLSFTIVPKGTKLSSVKAGKKQVTVKWKAQKKSTTGYQVQYSTSKKFEGAKIATIKKNKTTSATIKKLKGGKKYYVRVRTYKTVGKTKYYSAWSNVKNAKAKN